MKMMPDDLTDFGFTKVPIAEKAGRVAEVFRSVAGKYDLMNDLMSLGSHRLMKRFAVELTTIRAGDQALDLAGGTGDMAALLSPLVGESGQVTLCDINHTMLTVGRDRLVDRGLVANIQYVEGDAEQLPFPDGEFNVITIAFGLRNVTNKARALTEMLRVLKPGGHLVILEFSHARNPVVKSAYNAFANFWPRVGQLVTGDRDSYQYLVESIRVHPDQETLKAMMEDAGYTQASYYNLADGIAAIHTGIKGI